MMVGGQEAKVSVDAKRACLLHSEPHTLKSGHYSHSLSESGQLDMSDLRLLAREANPNFYFVTADMS